jgi:hypothetical protein
MLPEEFSSIELDQLLPNIEQSTYYLSEFDDDKPIKFPPRLTSATLLDCASPSHIAALPPSLLDLTVESQSTDILPLLPRSLESLEFNTVPEEPFFAQLEEWRLLPPKLTSLRMFLHSMGMASYLSALPSTLTDLSIELSDARFEYQPVDEYGQDRSMEYVEEAFESHFLHSQSPNAEENDHESCPAHSDPDLPSYLPESLVRLEITGIASDTTWIQWISRLSHLKRLATLDVRPRGGWKWIPVAPVIALLPRTITVLTLTLNSFEQDFPIDTLSKLPPLLRHLEIHLGTGLCPSTPSIFAIWNENHFLGLPNTLELLYVRGPDSHFYSVGSSIFEHLPPWIQRLKIGSLCDGEFKNECKAYFARTQWI